MTDQTDDNSSRRRLVLRRGRMGGGGSSFSQGGTARVESFQGSEDAGAIGDAVDDAIDPNEFNRQVQARANLPAPVTPDQARDNPRARLDEVALSGSAAYAKEFRLNMLHRMLMRNVPLDQIARQLQVSISTVEKDRAELKRRLREAAKELDINEMVGNQSAFYDEIQALSLRVASGDAPTAMKLAAMRTSLAANADRARFLNASGVFDALRFRRGEDNATTSDVQLLMQRTAEMLAELGDDTPEVPAPRPAIRRAKPGGFNAPTFDDPDASSSSNEVQEL